MKTRDIRDAKDNIYQVNFVDNLEKNTKVLESDFYIDFDENDFPEDWGFCEPDDFKHLIDLETANKLLNEAIFDDIEPNHQLNIYLLEKDFEWIK